MADFQGGALICNERARDNCGTLACIVEDTSNPAVHYLLTAGHVIAMNGYAQHGDAVLARRDDGQWIKVAEFERAAPLRDVNGVSQSCDVAIARLLRDDLVDPEIRDIGRPLDLATGVFPNMNLQLYGAGTNARAVASLHSSGNSVPITFRDLSGGDPFTLQFQDQILYGAHAGDTWTSVTSAMDSGALVFDADGRAVGLHIAVTADGYPVSASVCTPIERVLDALGVRLLGTGAATGGGGLPGPTVPEPKDADTLGQASFAMFGVSVRSLLDVHNAFGGVTWKLTSDGIVVGGSLDRSAGKLVTVPRVWSTFKSQIIAAATSAKVPLELLVATICAESSGNPEAIRTEPGYISDDATPGRVSVGLMQTLIETARAQMPGQVIDRQALIDPATSLQAGARYIASHATRTMMDPPLVACDYNAGHLERNDSDANRWKILQYPVGTGQHADRFTMWFNDCMAFFRESPTEVPGSAPSFTRLFRG